MSEALLNMIEELKLSGTNQYPNPFAYETKYGRLLKENGDKIFVDCKGQWKISGLSPKDLGWNGEKQIPRYELCMKLLNERHPKLKWTHFVYVVVWEDDKIEDLKQRIKAYIGYIPQPKTLKTIYTLVQEMIFAWKEQDLWYSMQDKVMAQQKIEGLKKLLIERYQGEDVQRESNGYRSDTPTWMHYLTKTEEQELKEYQRMVNGRYYLNETTSYGTSHGILGLATFAKDVITQIHEIDKERKEQSKREHQDRLSVQLETAPLARKLTAHYIEASKEAKQYGVKDTIIQLVHRLYGYTMNEESYYQKFHEFHKEYLKPLHMESWDLYYLAREAVKNDEVLPPAQSYFERTKWFYYGDQVLIEDRRRMVKRVGLKYLHIEQGGGKLLYQKAIPYRPEAIKKIG